MFHSALRAELPMSELARSATAELWQRIFAQNKLTGPTVRISRAPAQVSRPGTTAVMSSLAGTLAGPAGALAGLAGSLAG